MAAGRPAHKARCEAFPSGSEGAAPGPRGEGEEACGREVPRRGRFPAGSLPSGGESQSLSLSRPPGSQRSGWPDCFRVVFPEWPASSKALVLNPRAVSASPWSPVCSQVQPQRCCLVSCDSGHWAHGSRCTSAGCAEEPWPCQHALGRPLGQRPQCPGFPPGSFLCSGASASPRRELGRRLPRQDAPSLQALAELPAWAPLTAEGQMCSLIPPSVLHLCTWELRLGPEARAHLHLGAAGVTAVAVTLAPGRQGRDQPPECTPRAWRHHRAQHLTSGD